MLHVNTIHAPWWRVMLVRRRPKWLWISLGFGLGAPMGAIIGRFLT